MPDPLPTCAPPLSSLACPLCASMVGEAPAGLACSGCGSVFPQRDRGMVDLFPAGMWDPDKSRWRAMARAFPCLAEPVRFVRGTAEHLPFATGLFDWVMSFWSLNHTADPAAALTQMSRVLRPGGGLLLVLEDVQPTWDDVLSGAYVDHRSSRVATLARRAFAPLGGWPLQADRAPRPDLCRVPRRRDTSVRPRRRGALR